MALAKGTYAVFTTTEGKITVRLFESDAPITVKNFIELAEGGKEWTHPTTHAKSTDKLFDGTIHHDTLRYITTHCTRNKHDALYQRL